MVYFIICLTALGTSFMTIFSGFGLGTLLMPAFALFFPIELAVAMTAIVHFLNNIFKFVLFGKYTDRNVLLKFAIPGIIAALIGAFILTQVSGFEPIAGYAIGSKNFEITIVKLVVGLIMIGFAFFELLPKFSKIQFDKKWLPFGGMISGFFGGLSGNQGAMRSAFLSKAGLSKEAFVGTGVAIAMLIDIARLTIYTEDIFRRDIVGNWLLILVATLCAFLGAFIGKKIFKKVTIRTIQVFVGILLILVGVCLAIGITSTSLNGF